MGFRKISADCKMAAIRLHDNGQLELETILGCCGFSERTWYRILKLYRETGNVVATGPNRRGRLRTLDTEDINYLLRLVQQNPDYFLDELLTRLNTNQFISVHFTTIFRELERAGMSHKKLKHIAVERNEERHADFVIQMAQYQAEEIGFLDETSKDYRTPSRVLLTLDGISAGTVVEGSMTKETFLHYLEFIVVSSSRHRLCSFASN
ncbi:hypothetical protein FIBSPDRAFT_740554 [Athelia psychrophila]|uniref:Winged helix-turn helix domain-containing protein n=1 Tax=Athelia psychrophila TaxID=1759441 RepID=A0A167THW3_9AGAM|nr:hypothetical protein FIBSPDRAFT_769661 [Fibularhizoctonia sp. CBS 109695]KZP21405.1 hypothetical protein FIBSPDRAFT_740554 [Fibularhizoctonia sp. CBS 109695]